MHGRTGPGAARTRHAQMQVRSHPQSRTRHAVSAYMTIPRFPWTRGDVHDQSVSCETDEILQSGQQLTALSKSMTIQPGHDIQRKLPHRVLKNAAVEGSSSERFDSLRMASITRTAWRGNSIQGYSARQGKRIRYLFVFLE